MTPIWEPSSWKHGVEKFDQMYAIQNATFVAVLPEMGRHGGKITLFIGPEHAQTDRELEILVEDFGGGQPARIFHAMPLGPKFRRYREEHANGSVE